MTTAQTLYGAYPGEAAPAASPAPAPSPAPSPGSAPATRTTAAGAAPATSLRSAFTPAGLRTDPTSWLIVTCAVALVLGHYAATGHLIPR